MNNGDDATPRLVNRSRERLNAERDRDASRSSEDPRTWGQGLVPGLYVVVAIVGLVALIALGGAFR